MALAGSLARWRAALSTLVFGVLAPAVALAQDAEAGHSERRFGWLWLIAAVLVVIVLFRMFFSRPPRSPPSRP